MLCTEWASEHKKDCGNDSGGPNFNPPTIEQQFAELAAWSRAHGASVILNEFGVLRFKSPRPSRLEWLRDVRETAEANRFGWAHWDYREGFGLLDGSGRPDVELIDQLLPSQRRASTSGSDR